MCGGGGPIEDIVEDVKETTLDDVINVGTQVATGGLAGFGDGGFKTGVITESVGDVVVPILKDVTGAAAAEQAIEDSRRRFAEGKQEEKDRRAESKANTAREQLLRSRQAGAARGGVRIQSSSLKGGSRFSSLGGEEEDILGL